MKKLAVLLTGLLLTLSVRASSPITLSDFSAFTPSYYGGSWSLGTSVSGSESFTIADLNVGPPKNDGSFTVNLGSAQDFSSYQYVNLDGSVFAGNTTSSFSFFVEDSGGASGMATFQTADFASGYSSVSLAGLYSVLDTPNSIVRWGFTTENQLGDENFAFTFDKVTLSASPIPEPSTYAAMAGGLSLFVAIVARRRRRVCV